MGLMISLMMLWACSSDDEVAEAPAPASASEHEIPIAVSASASLFEDVTEEPFAARRATEWTPPTGYYLYEKLYED